MGKEVCSRVARVLENVVDKRDLKTTSHRHRRNSLMRFIGADLHKRSITFRVVETDGHQIRVVRRQIFIGSHVLCQLTVEATIGYEGLRNLPKRMPPG